MYDENEQNVATALTQYMINRTNDEENDLSLNETEVEQVGTLEIANTKHPIYKKTTVVIGRDPSKSQIVLSDMTVSQQHATICADDQGRISVIDLQSSNGTMMNEKRLKPNQPLALMTTKTLMFGEVSAIFTSSDEDRNIGVQEPQNPQLQLTTADPMFGSISSLPMVNQPFQLDIPDFSYDDDLNDPLLNEQQLQSIIARLVDDFSYNNDPTFQLPQCSSLQIAPMESNLCYTSPYDCDSNDTVSSKLSLESSAFAYSDSVNESGYSSSSLLSPPEILIELLDDYSNSSIVHNSTQSVNDFCDKWESESNEDKKVDTKFSNFSFDVRVAIETLSSQVLLQHLGTKYKVEGKKRRGRPRKTRKGTQTISSLELDVKLSVQLDEQPRGGGARYNLRSRPRVDYEEMENPTVDLPPTRRRKRKPKSLADFSSAKK